MQNVCPAGFQIFNFNRFTAGNERKHDFLGVLVDNLNQGAGQFMLIRDIHLRCFHSDVDEGDIHRVFGSSRQDIAVPLVFKRYSNGYDFIVIDDCSVGFFRFDFADRIRDFRITGVVAFFIQHIVLRVFYRIEGYRSVGRISSGLEHFAFRVFQFKAELAFLQFAVHQDLFAGELNPSCGRVDVGKVQCFRVDALFDRQFSHAVIRDCDSNNVLGAVFRHAFHAECGLGHLILKGLAAEIFHVRQTESDCSEGVGNLSPFGRGDRNFILFRHRGAIGKRFDLHGGAVALPEDAFIDKFAALQFGLTVCVVSVGEPDASQACDDTPVCILRFSAVT